MIKSENQVRKKWYNPLSYPLFVVLAIVLPPLHLIAFNPHFVSYTQILSALLPYVSAQAAVFLLLWGIFRCWTKAAFACFVITIAFWFFLFSMPLVAALLALLGLVCGYEINDRHQRLIYNYLNNFSVCLAVFVSWNVFANSEVKGNPDTLAAEEERLFPRLNSLQVSRDRLPSIVHIVADGYGAKTVLQTYFSYDNAEFETQLREMGFVVFDSAVSPYNQTLFVMSAIFSGGYIKPQALSANRMRGILGLSVSQGLLRKFFVNRGAKFYATPSGYNFFPLFPGDNLVGPVPSSAKQVSRFSSVLQFLRPASFINNPITRLIRDISAGKDESTLLPPSYYSDNLLVQTLDDNTYYRQESPFFLYNHLIAPHPPFTIDREGKPTQRWPFFKSMGDASHVTSLLPERIAAYREGYVEKLRYLNSRLQPKLKDMIASIRSPKIIILHGDHGPGSAFHHDKIQAACINERFRPFLAVYTDDEKLRVALQELSSPAQGPFNLVNLYRVIFKYYFGAPIELLPNKSFFIPWATLRARTLVTPESIQAVCK